MYVGLKVLHAACIILYTYVNHLCTLYLYSFLAVVYREPHGRLALFFAKCVTL